MRTISSFAFWKDIFIAFVGAFFGFGFSLWLYYRQVRKDAEKKEIERIQKYKDLLSYYEQLIISIIDLYNRQLDLVDEFIENQKKDYLDLQVLKRKTTNDFSRIKNIDNIGVFEAWGHFFGAENQYIKEYKNANAALDFLEGSLEEMDKIFASHTKACYDELMIIKGNIDHVPDHLSMLAMKTANELGEKRWSNEWYVFLDTQINLYHELIKEEANIHAIESEFLSPMIEILLSKFRSNPSSIEILDLCKKIRVKLHHVSNDVKNAITQFETLRQRTSTSLATLNVTKQKIEAIL